MSEDVTRNARQLARIEIVTHAYKSFVLALEKLDCDILSEDAIDNLRSLAGQMEQHIDELNQSARKLLD